MRRAAKLVILVALLAGCTTTVPAPSPRTTPTTHPVAARSPSAEPIATTAPSPVQSALAVCGPGSVSASIDEISPTRPQQEAYALIGLTRTSGACKLSRLSAVTVRDASRRTVVKVSDGDVWTSDLSIAVAVRLLFVSLCPTVRSLPLSVELDLGNGLVVVATLPRSFAMPCNDGSRRAFVDGIVEAPGGSPNPGGTCSAGQFVVGTSSSYYTYSTASTRHVVIDQPLRNTGGPCVLQVPGSIGVAAGLDPFQAVSVINRGNEVCAQGACHYVTPSTYNIGSGQSLSLGFSASWWIGGSSAGETPAPPPPCAQALSNVNRAAFPVASGSIEIAWDIELQQVCSAPASISFAIDLK